MNSNSLLDVKNKDNLMKVLENVISTINSVKKDQEILQLDITKEREARTKMESSQSKGETHASDTTDFSRSTSSFDQLDTRSKNIMDQVENLIKMVYEIKDCAIKNETAIDDLEQYGRRNCILLHGCRNLPTTNHYGEFEYYVASTLNSALKLKLPIQYGDIDITHVLPPDNKGNVPIIIKFVRRSTKNMVYALKKRLKGSGLSITESLTKKRIVLLKQAREALGLRGVWTINGDIFGIYEGKKKLIRSLDDINDLISHSKAAYSKAIKTSS